MFTSYYSCYAAYCYKTIWQGCGWDNTCTFWRRTGKRPAWDSCWFLPYCKCMNMEGKLWLFYGYTFHSNIIPYIYHSFLVSLHLSYGFGMVLKSEPPIWFPYHILASVTTMGIISNLTKYVAIPQNRYGNAMVLIPIPSAMGNLWNFTKYIAVP